MLQRGSAIGESTCTIILPYHTSFSQTGEVSENQDLRGCFWIHRAVGPNAGRHILSCCGTAILAGKSETAGGRK